MAWRELLDRVAASPLCREATLRSWTRAVDTLEATEDADARQLIERLLSQGAAMWQVAEEMYAGVPEPAPRPRYDDESAPATSLQRTSPPYCTYCTYCEGSAAVFAQFFAAVGYNATGDSAGNPTAPNPVVNLLAANLSGVAFGALAAHGRAEGSHGTTFGADANGARAGASSVLRMRPAWQAEGSRAAAPGRDSIDRQLRSLVEAVELGYDAHADSPEFARDVAAAFDAWVDQLACAGASGGATA